MNGNSLRGRRVNLGGSVQWGGREGIGRLRGRARTEISDEICATEHFLDDGKIMGEASQKVEPNLFFMYGECLNWILWGKKTQLNSSVLFNSIQKCKYTRHLICSERETAPEEKLHTEYAVGEEKLPLNRQKPWAETDSVWMAICCNRLGGREGEDRRGGGDEEKMEGRGEMVRETEERDR